MDDAPAPDPSRGSSTSAGSSGLPPGRAPGRAPVAGPNLQRLHRCRHQRMLGGVASGLADYFGVDPLVVRIAFVVMALMGGVAVPLYLAGWLLIPDEDAELSVAEELMGRDRPR